MTTMPRIFTALVTPFDDRGNLDTGRLTHLVQTLVAQGSEGFVLAGSTGESPTLSMDERRRMVETTQSAIGSARVAVWLGTGSNDTRQAQELTEAADRWGVDGMLVVAPYYSKPPQEGLYRHFRAIAECTGRPVMLYNVPGRTAVNVLPETVLRVMRDCPNVLAIKEASGSLEQITELARTMPSDRLLYAGDDALFFDTLAVGGYGVVSIASHIVERQMSDMVAAFLDGDTETARRIHLALVPLFHALFTVSNPIPLKWALNRMGLTVGPVRLPLVTPEDETFDALWQLMQGLSISSLS